VSNEETKCPQGWDQTQLLAYMERDLDKTAREELEAHLKSCETCASEVESLRKMDVLLKHHSEIFHPDEQQLYRYVTAGDDPEGEIAWHLEGCENCQEDVALLEEIINARSEVPIPIPAMPQELLRRIERLHPAAAPESVLKRLYLTATELISAPFRMPTLALGTAAAVIVLAVISVPLWRHLHHVPRPDLGVAVQEPPAQKPSEAAPAEADQYRQDLEKDRLVEKPKRFRSKPYGGAGVPPSPAPSVTPPPDAKFEKFDDRESGPIGAAPGAAPPQLPPSPQVMQERSHRPALGMVPYPEGEISARSRAPKTPIPVAPMKKEAVKRQYPTAAQEARPERETPASLSDLRIPVRIRIVDSEGKSIQGIKFLFPGNLLGRYHLLGETESGAADLVLIRVVKRDGVSDLTASLFDPNYAGARQTLQASDVAERDLGDRIGSLVSSLLEKK